MNDDKVEEIANLVAARRRLRDMLARLAGQDASDSQSAGYADACEIGPSMSAAAAAKVRQIMREDFQLQYDEIARKITECVDAPT
ncbi:MAG: hypothetical protein A3E01_10020 [Gammaproteobacteria bacterium RIFCSPHIGHO2_12_FULL_63_22]|nr:MAG: hypothetical protein A3E01_10020 [Gammaproteobacteria bacterium RIFCSPHIGHO2_12_FULL_63_22]